MKTTIAVFNLTLLLGDKLSSTEFEARLYVSHPSQWFFS